MKLEEDSKEYIDKKFRKNNFEINNEINNYYIKNEALNDNDFLGRKRNLERSRNQETNKFNYMVKNFYPNDFGNNYKYIKYSNLSIKNEYNKIKNNMEDLNSYSKLKRESVARHETENRISTRNNKNNYNKEERVNSKAKEINKNPINIGEYTYYEQHQIGTGSFGKVFCGTHRTKNFKVAIKIPTEKANLDMINKEVKYTKMMMKEPGFPILIHSCVFNNKHIIIESLLGPSLDKLFIYCGKLFPIKTICLIGIEIVRRLQSMHKVGLLHRDLKPNNFTWGNFTKNNHNHNLLKNLSSDFDTNSIFLIDFGLSDPYMDLKTKKHYRNQKGMKFVGTLRYSSVNSHRGIRQCRKDDLESLMYILIYFYKGKLPWQDIKSKKKADKHKKIKEKKSRTTTYNLCQGMPPEFEKLLIYIKKLAFDETPNYDKIIDGFQSIIDNLTEWDILESGYNYIWEKKLADDLNKTNSINDEESSKIINENINQIFKGYPVDIKKYIENISINSSNNLTASSSNIKSTISSCYS